MLLRLPLSNLAGIRNGFMGTTELSYLAVFDLYTLGRTAQLVARAASRKVLWNTDNRSISRCGKGFFLLELTISSGFFHLGLTISSGFFSPGVNYQFRLLRRSYSLRVQITCTNICAQALRAMPVGCTSFWTHENTEHTGRNG